MKLLLDESIPKNLSGAFPDYFEIHTVQKMGWSGTKNGKLLRLVQEHGYSELITADKGIAYQQNPGTMDIVIIVLKAFRTHIDYLGPLVPQVLELLEQDPDNGVHVLGE
jgi:hypothetical protein